MEWLRVDELKVGDRFREDARPDVWLVTDVPDDGQEDYTLAVLNTGFTHWFENWQRVCKVNEES